MGRKRKLTQLESIFEDWQIDQIRNIIRPESVESQYEDEKKWDLANHIMSAIQQAIPERKLLEFGGQIKIPFDKHLNSELLNLILNESGWKILRSKNIVTFDFYLLKYGESPIVRKTVLYLAPV